MPPQVFAKPSHRANDGLKTKPPKRTSERRNGAVLARRYGVGRGVIYEVKANTDDARVPEKPDAGDEGLPGHAAR